ncbi:DUF58 domain-containing protein [Cyanobacterium sp. Dongsha4]|uniref:DUF58 domain-containing protein n=1 Tax=Cyanobacterium sp. DS4 TaxID=2878255 RepID=UPI002E7FFE99|nr:DUF58 domain-containing protein [Cyanobacterium sp. Dongsha4]WVK99174.1 DUF58 domain-containing protein [Cyanobacterium sp. Dongsha4]
MNHSVSSTKSPLNLIQWLEYHWATPAYGGWVLIGIALSFFGAATNTMAGWLYVLSGMLLSLLGLNFVVAINTLKKLQIKRLAIASVHAGDELTLSLKINNPTQKNKTLITILEHIPPSLGKEIKHNIETLPSGQEILLTAYLQTNNRGIYHWDYLSLRTAAPFGLFYCSRYSQVKTSAIVYPHILTLQNCPLIDNLGQEEARKRESNQIYNNATEGVTKALRQYRYGDPIRLIHWRTSARLGELQVRELETITGGEEITICLDNSGEWDKQDFENAVIAVASMYCYASRQQLEVKVWIGDMGLIHGRKVTLETLAGVNYGGTMKDNIPQLPLIWISHNSNYLNSLPLGSRYFLFNKDIVSSSLKGIIYDSETSLISQLQKPLQ